MHCIYNKSKIVLTANCFLQTRSGGEAEVNLKTIKSAEDEPELNPKE